MNAHRLLSALVAAAYVVHAYIRDPGPRAFFLITSLILPLGCIWFGDELGEFTGWASRRYITKTSPGCLIKLVGWALLLAPAICFLATGRNIMWIEQ